MLSAAPAVSLILPFLLVMGTLRAGWSATDEFSDPKFVEQVFLTEEGALKSVFAGAAKIDKEVRVFTLDQKRNIESRLGWILDEKEATVYRAYDQGQNPLGYAMITEEIGKFKPITFIVKTSNDGKIERVEVMVYREAVGAEVRKQRFLRQFRNKSSKDSLRINRDIINLTGATMSVQAMTAGIKKVLVILNEIYFKTGKNHE